MYTIHRTNNNIQPLTWARSFPRWKFCIKCTRQYHIQMFQYQYLCSYIFGTNNNTSLYIWCTTLLSNNILVLNQSTFFYSLKFLCTDFMIKYSIKKYGPGISWYCSDTDYFLKVPLYLCKHWRSSNYLLMKYFFESSLY